MLSLRRQSAGALSPLTLCLAFLFLFAATARAAVLGIDFGTLHIKAALIKPGVPLDIVLTKDSKRKEVAAVAFKPNRDEKNNIITAEGSYPERAYGGDALALQGRFPSEVFPNLKLLLGLQTDDEEAAKTVEVYKQRYPAVQVAQDESLGGAPVIRSAGFPAAAAPFTVEELIGMELANIKRNAAAMAGAGSAVDDVVITIPPFFTAAERRAIVTAAELAGFKVAALISDGLAVGLDYAKTRTFPEVSKGEQPEYHIVYDMGAGSTSATLMRFQARSVKDVGRFNKTVQEVAVLGVGWDRTLGGDGLNDAIMNFYVAELLAKSAVQQQGITEAAIRANGRLMGRLFKEAERARQILSANSEVSSGFEEILPDIDLRTKLSRADFEALVADAAPRVDAPVHAALAMAGLRMADVSSIILHGGAVRTPFVQARLESLAGGAAKLRNNVNTDESAVFGAAFKAAGLSASFKVKEIRDADVAGYAAQLVYTDPEKGKERRQTLFTPASPWGAAGAATVKQVAFKDKKDFGFGFTQNVEGQERKVLKVESGNLTEGVAELNRKFGCEVEEVATKFSVRLSGENGLPEVVAGLVSCEVDGAGKAGSVGDTVKDWLGFGKKKEQEVLGGEAEDVLVEEVEASTATSSKKTKKDKASSSTKSGSSTSGASAAAEASEVPQKRTESIPVKFTSSPDGSIQRTPDQLKTIRSRLASFDASDRSRVAREEALNLLESYTYYVRDFLTNTDYESVSTAAQRSAIGTLLQTTTEWMEGPGALAKATKETLKEKLDALKKLVEPIVTRKKEGAERPELVKKLKESIEQTGTLLKSVESQIEAAVKARESAIAYESSASASAAASASEAAASAAENGEAMAPSTDDLEDLEEPIDATSSADVPKYTSPTDFNPYANLDLTSIQAVYDSVRSWLTEQESAQEKLGPHEDPVLTVRELESKAAALGEAMRELVYKQMRAASKTAAGATATGAKKAKATKAKAGKKEKTKTSAATEEAQSTEEAAAAAAGAKKKKKVTGAESIEELLGSKGDDWEKDEL